MAGPQKRLCAALWKIKELMKSGNNSNYISETSENGYFQKKRKEQNKFWLLQTIESSLKSNFYENEEIKKELATQLKRLSLNETTPFEAADLIFKAKKLG